MIRYAFHRVNKIRPIGLLKLQLLLILNIVFPIWVLRVILIKQSCVLNRLVLYPKFLIEFLIQITLDLDKLLLVICGMVFAPQLNIQSLSFCKEQLLEFLLYHLNIHLFKSFHQLFLTIKFIILVQNGAKMIIGLLLKTHLLLPGASNEGLANVFKFILIKSTVV